MKLIVVHGDNIEKVTGRVSAFVDTAKKRGWQIVRMDAENKLSISETLTAGELFEKEKLFLLTGLTKADKKELEWLKKNKSNFKGNVVVYEEGIISKKNLSLLPKPDKVEEYKLPKVIFKFLEAFYPGNSETALKLLHEISEPAEFTVALLARHLKDLYIILSDGELNYPSWRVGKLKGQAKNFTQDKVKSIISELSEADVNSKTSRQDLLSSLDLIIATRLE